MEKAVGSGCVSWTIVIERTKIEITRVLCSSSRKMDEADQDKAEDKLEGSHGRVNWSVICR